MCTLRVKDAKGGCPYKIVTDSDDEHSTMERYYNSVTSLLEISKERS